MAITVNQSAVTAQPAGSGVRRQKLLTSELVPGTKILLDRLTLAAGARMAFEPSAKSLVWLQMLSGAAKLEAFYTDTLSDSHSALLPPGFKATVTTADGATLLCAEIPDLAAVDPNFAARPPVFQVIDWAREPVFVAEQDARKRVLIVSTATCGTAVMRADLVVYPPGSAAPDFHHEGADTLIYVASGRGAGSAGEGLFPLRAGDVVYLPDRKRHHLKAADSELRFFEIYLPGTFKTVWADPSKASAWRSTGRDIYNRETERDTKERIIYAHSAGNPFTR